VQDGAIASFPLAGRQLRHPAKKEFRLFNHQRLQCYEYTFLLAQTVPALVATWPKGSAQLVDQLQRALTSVLLNIAEGNGKTSLADRKRFFSFARGSGAEVASCMDIAFAFRYIDSATHAHWQTQMLRVVKMLYKLK